jgi:hypothetical protein
MSELKSPTSQVQIEQQSYQTPRLRPADAQRLRHIVVRFF